MSVTVASSSGSMPLKLMNASAPADDAIAAPDEGGGCADDARNLAQRRDFGAIVLNAGCLEHEDVRGRAEDAIAQLALQAGHHRHRDDEREHADGDAERGDERK